MLVWRLVFEKIATLEEIERSWNLDDVLRANDLIDYKNHLINRERSFERNH